MLILPDSVEVAVAFEDVTVAFGGGTILEKVTTKIPRSGCTAIVGPNGAGKTTFLLTLLGRMPHGGQVRINQSVQGRQPRIGYIPQRLDFDRGMPLTVMEFMVMGQQRLPLWFGCRTQHRKRAMELLAAVKAETLEQRALGAISGGEMQRVLLALALQQEPDLLVLDEPTAGLDLQGENLFCELLESLRRERGFTQVMVNHDLATVTHHATHVILLNRSVIAAGPPREVLTNENLTAVFGLHMGLAASHALPEGSANCSARCCRGDDDA